MNFSETLKQTHEYKQNLKLQYNYISLFTYSRIHISSCIYIIFRIFSVIRNKSRILLIFDEIGYCRGYNQYTILVILAISILPFWMIRKKKKRKNNYVRFISVSTANFLSQLLKIIPGEAEIYKISVFIPFISNNNGERRTAV